MKANIEIEFLKINGRILTPSNCGTDVQEATIKTTRVLCEQIAKYFLEKKIETKVSFEVK